jgi:dienelactone hydrolase
MRSVLNSAVPGSVAATGIVCLPGAYHTPEDFLAAGFDDSVRRREMPVDLILVDVEMQHLGDRRAVAQLHEEIVLPSRARGYKTLWFLGISLGGFIALDYACGNREHLNGVCALAPYLGNRILTGEIARTGLATWHAGPLADSDEERRVWGFLKAQKPHSRFLYLGFGQNDWRTWKTLWEHFLDSPFL